MHDDALCNCLAGQFLIIETSITIIMKIFNGGRFWALFILGFALSFSAQSQTTYLTVGCGGTYPNFPTLRAAFAHVESNYHPADIDISICSGVYWEDAYINATAAIAPGAEIRVHSATLNPADVTIHPFSLFQAQILRINGVKNMKFEGLTLEVNSVGSGLSRHVVRTQGGAGDLHFKDCRLLGITPTMGFYSRNDYSVFRANDLDGMLQFFDCELRDGSQGIYVASGSSNSLLNLQSSLVFGIKGEGVREDVPLFLTQIDDSHINCAGGGDWAAVSTTYGPNTRLFMDSTTVITYGANRCLAVQASAHEIGLRSNTIRMAEHPTVYGINIHPKAAMVDVEDNSIDYPGMMVTTIRPDSFMGIQRVPALFSQNDQLDHLRIAENEVRCNGAKEGMGIFTQMAAEDLNTGLFVQDNEVQLDDFGDENAFWISGIAMRGETGAQLGAWDASGNRVMIEAKDGYVSYGMWLTLHRPNTGPTIYNNNIEVRVGGTDSTTGLGLAGIRSLTGAKTYVGNNMVSVEGHPNAQTNGVYVHFTTANEYVLWHNSVNVYGPASQFGSDAIHLWGQTYGGTIEFWDNIFSNQTGGRAFHNAIYTGNWIMSESNCYYVNSGANLGSWNGVLIPDLPTFQSAYGAGAWDALSVDFNPNFVAPFDLHLATGSPLLGYNGYHLSFSGPTHPLNWDIDGDGRNPANNREIGADERGLPEYNPDWKTAPLVTKTALQVYPQPATDAVQIRWEGHAQARYQLWDMAGRLVLDRNPSVSEFSLDLQALKAGIYFLRASEGVESVQQRLIIQ